MNHTKTSLTFQQKVKVLTKLYEGGCKTEKELQSLELSEMLKIPNISVPELSIIVALQKSVKAHTLYSYLGGEGNEQQKQDEGSSNCLE